MKYTQQQVVGALEGARQFVSANAATLRVASESQVMEIVDEAIANLRRHQIDQGTGARLSRGASARRVAEIKQVLQLHVQAVKAAARLHAKAVPELASLTVRTKAEGTSAVIADARAAATVAIQHSAILVPILGADFAALLQKGADDLEAAQSDVRSARVAGVGATSGIAVAAARGTSALRVLDRLVMREAWQDDEKLAQWRAARRVQRSRRTAQVIIEGPGGVTSGPEAQNPKPEVSGPEVSKPEVSKPEVSKPEATSDAISG
jgi:hypothetical protein